MTDYTKLIKELRETAKHFDGISRFPYDDDPAKRIYSKMMTDAAAAIEALQAEVDTLKRVDYKRCQECLYLGQPVDEQQLPKRGEWQKAKPKGVVTYSDGYAECSHCHETIWLGWGMNFCPHCGTQNRIIDPDDYDGEKIEVQDETKI